MGSSKIYTRYLFKHVVILAVILIVIDFVPTSVFAETITVTASVDVSDLWAYSIARNSTISLEQLDGKKYLKVECIGLNYERLSNHRIKMIMFSNSNGSQSLTGLTDQNGDAYFVYDPNLLDKYNLAFIDETFPRKIKLLNRLTPKRESKNILNSFFDLLFVGNLRVLG